MPDDVLEEKTILVPETDGDTAPLTKAPEAPVVAKPAVVDEAADILKKQLEDSKAEATRLRAAHAEAERRARDADARAGQADGEIKLSQIAAVTNAIDARKTARETAQSDYAAALEHGDYKKVAELQVRIADLSAEMQTLNQTKEIIEQQQATAKDRPRDTIENLDPVEKFISTVRLGPKSADWIRQHPDALSRQAKLARAHDEALEDGAKFESPEYFQTIERIMGFQQDAGSTDDAPAAKPALRAAERRPAAAPASSSAGTANSRSTEVRMTPEMRRAAEISGVTDQEYALQYANAKKQGLIGQNVH